MAVLETVAVVGLTEVIKKLYDFKDKVDELKAVSLTQMNKPANIISRVYIQQDVAADDIALPLLGTLNQLYASYIMTALNMQNVVAGGKTVRELYGVIATETLQDTVAVIAEDFGQESLESTIQEMAVQDVTSSMEGGIVNQETDSQRLVTGRLLEVDLTLESQSDKDGNVHVNTYKLYVYVQLVPFILTDEISKGLLNVNFYPPMSTRWKQVQAKEISFWNDFMFSRDLLEKQEKLLKNDKSGILSEILNRQHNKLFRMFSGLLGFRSKSSNLANSIIIIDKNTFNEACREVGVDFSNKAHRNSFMFKTMAIFVVVVDLSAGVVEMYFNGIDVKGTYTFAMLNRVGAKGKDNFNLAEIMQTFSQGMSPRF